MSFFTPRVIQHLLRPTARLLCVSVALGGSLFAGEIATLSRGEIVTLSSGAQLAVDWHESVGELVRLHQGDGLTEIPAQLIVGYETRIVPEAPAPGNLEKVEAPPVAEVSTVVVTPLPPRSLDPKELLRDAAIRAGLPPEFVTSVAKVESGFRPDALSPKGAIGIMQLMPDTAKALGADPHDLEQNIDAGTRLLRDLLVKYDGDVVKTLAAYNAGEKAVEKYSGLPPYDETRFYVNRVIGAYQKAGGR